MRLSPAQLMRISQASLVKTSPANLAKMRYPYTLGAMVMQTPWKYYISKSWVFKAYALGLVLSAPLFIKITYSFPEEEKK